MVAESVSSALLPGYLCITVLGPERGAGRRSVIELIVDSTTGHRTFFGEELFYLTRVSGAKRRSNCSQEDHWFLNREQGGKCNGCRRDLSDATVELDHYIPLAYGGPDVMGNWQLLCRNCNRIKGNRPMDYLLSVLARRYPPGMDASHVYLRTRKSRAYTAVPSYQPLLLTLPPESDYEGTNTAFDFY